LQEVGDLAAAFGKSLQMGMVLAGRYYNRLNAIRALLTEALGT
jgi:hypothetical protein